MNYICADIRTDMIVYSLADERGTLSDSKEIPVTEKDWKSVVQALHAIVRSYDGEEKLDGLALSVPCLVEPGEGIILSGEEQGQDYHLAESVTAACGLPCSVENTVKCTALGEYWLGAGQRSHLLFCLSMGNRISGAAVIDGCILHGASFSAGEIGYMKIGSSVTFGEAASIQALLQNVAAARQVPAASLDEKSCSARQKAVMPWQSWQSAALSIIWLPGLPISAIFTIPIWSSSAAVWRPRCGMSGPFSWENSKKDSDPWYMNIRASPLLIWEKRQP